MGSITGILGLAAGIYFLSIGGKYVKADDQGLGIDSRKRNMRGIRKAVRPGAVEHDRTARGCEQFLEAIP